MSEPIIRITAASRLHFGLYGFGRRAAGQRNYGGVGMMVDRPSLELTLSPAERLSVAGPHAQRVVQFAQRWAGVTGAKHELACHFQVETAPSQHAGLGVGTQLGLSVAAGLNALFDHAQPTPAKLAALTSRGARSAVGLYGFLQGGLLVDDGKLPGQRLSPLAARCEVPPLWRMVLVRPLRREGLSGDQEKNAFAQLPPVSAEFSAILRREVDDRMLPALAAKDFQSFSRSIYQFGKAAGECFSAVQGGAYNGPQLCEIVKTARSLGVEGVGQSSWGPTIFCLLPDESSARDFAGRMSLAMASKDVECTISAPCNHGARTSRSWQPATAR